MTLSRVNGSGWGVGQSLTSAQANALDINVTGALDKQSGHTDTLQAVISCSGAGRIIPTFVTGADANTHYNAGGGNTVISASSLTASRTYTLDTTSASAGDLITILGNGTYDVTVKDDASTTLIVVGAGSTGANQSRWADFVFNGSHFILLRSSYGPAQQRQLFTGNGTYTVPPDCYKLLVVGAGAGGGGGGGGNTRGNTSTNGSAGGGGGGAAMLGATWVDTTPGATFAVTLGTAGTGGAATSAGNDGGNTTFGTTLTLYGGQGGAPGVGGAQTPATAAYVFCPGGGPVAGGARGTPIAWGGAGTTVSAGAVSTIDSQLPIWWGVNAPGQGGYGRSSDASAGGTGSIGCYPAVSSTTGGSGSTGPGNGGAPGANSTGGSNVIGGGGGGGGGASAFGGGGGAGGGGGGGASSGSFGAGGTGGTGGAGSGSTGSTGSAGNNSGVGGTGGTGGAGSVAAGGGGAGGGGNGTSGGAGGTGGSGGGGVLIVIPVR